MEIAAAIVGSIFTEAAKYMITSIKKQIKYLSDHENKAQGLKDPVESLKDARDEVQHSVDAAKRNGEEIEHDVEKWLTTVNKKIGEVEKVMQDEEKAKKKCFLGLCWTRYRLNIKAEEMANAVAELLSCRAAPQFESRRLIFNGIMKALKDTSIKVIGVHGMGGVGKTTLVKEVARQIKEGRLFDSVVIVTVTQTLNVEKIQNQIADLLGLKFEEQTTVGRAPRLRQRLKDEKKILVVLDDIWERLDLKEVGIPFGNEHEGCKILLTSRDLNVLSNGMDTQQNFAVDVLNEDEAWVLFKKMAGDCVESFDLQSTAIKVAKKCAGLPIAIATVARALRNKSSFEWRNALRQLKRPSSGNLCAGVTAAAYSAIELSYNHLESEEVKLTFLLGSLIGHNGLIEDLLKYVVGLGYFQDVDTIKEARDEVLTVVSKLKACCLLLDSYNDDRFDIHDVVWSVALSIASRDRHTFVLKDGDERKKWPTNERMNNCCEISLLSPQIELPDEMECPDLSFFCMNHYGSVEIPANFFRRTERLKVLALTRMYFPSLPVSINLLTSLHTLCLDRCALEDISIIGKLRSLEILSLVGSDIKALPTEMGQLTGLRLLDLSGCAQLKIIPPNVLSKLSKLEELYMENSFVQWEEEVPGGEGRNASLEELKHLTHLTTLYAHFPNAQIIPERLFIETLDRYRIFIGDYDAQYWSFDTLYRYRIFRYDYSAQNFSNDYKYSRALKLMLYTSIYMDHGVKILLKKTEDLGLAQLKGIKNVADELSNGEGFPHLKKLYIENGLEVQYIATEKMEFSQLQSMTLRDLPQLISFSSKGRRCSTSQQEQGDTSTKPLFNYRFVFPQLKGLRLSSINTQRIWHNQLSETCYSSLSNLKSLIIKGCGKLEHLLSPSVATSLVQLQRLEIEECKCLREIIFTEEIEEGKKDVICFPQLNSLELRDLENLTKFCSWNYDIEFPSLKVLNVERCPNLKEFINQTEMDQGNYESGVQALFNEKVAVPRLQRMTISHLGDVKKIFHKELLSGSFCKLEEMTVKYCHQLSTIFSSTAVGVFLCLEKLEVGNCDSLEQIFELGGLSIEETLGVEYSQLREPKNLFPVSIAKDLPQLEHLCIRSCGVEEIVSAGETLEQPITFMFPQLSSLKLMNLKKLKCFYPGQHTIDWPMLKKLTTDYSALLKIVASERLSSAQEMNRNGQRDCTIGQQHLLVEEVFPKLEELRLHILDASAMMCDGQLPEDLLQQIKVFVVFGSSTSFPISFLHRFCNLEVFEFTNTVHLKGAVFCEGDVGEKPDAGTVPSRITELKLKFCKNLTHIWGTDSEVSHILPNLQTLEVKFCGDLINIGSSLSSSSFQNLTTLRVIYCKMMMMIITPSVAQSLVQLTTMAVTNCERMTEIVANEGADGATYEINFRKLKYIELDCLQNLASFCSGNHAFEFPSLEELIVSRCPNLKAFCQGVLSTPKLRRVKERSYHDRGRWADDLNTTIQLLYAKKVGYGGLYRLLMSDTCPELMEIWNTNPQEILDFKSLGHIEVCNCSSLKYIFTPSMAFSLKQLRSLVVKECGSMEQVIREQGVEEDATTYKFIFPSLRFIEIESCSNVTCFYLGSGAFELPLLGSIDIAECPKMATFASSFSRNKEKAELICQGSDEEDLHIAPTFFNDKVMVPKLNDLKLSSINIEKIWDLQLPASFLSAQNLGWLTISGCHNLKYLFPSSMLIHIVQLQFLHIHDCKIMEEVIFFMEGLTEEESMSHILFAELESLSLKDLPKLARFCSETHIEFPLLTSLLLINCPVLKTFIPKSVIEDVGDEPQIHQKPEGNNSALFNEKVAFPSLKNLTVEGMRECRMIWQRQLTVNSFCKLNNIRVEGCETLLNIFPFNMMERLEKLDELHIVNCDSLEEIFEPQGQGLFANQSHVIASTQSIAVETEAKFVFPKVTYLRFDKLPKLKCFYSRIHATEWPSLKKLEVIECQKVEIFASECPNFGETQTQSQVEISNQEILFWVNEVTFPILEELKLKQNDTLKGIWHGQLSTDCFRKLKVLELACVPGKLATLPYCFIQSLPDLETFVLNGASFSQLFQSEGLNDEERHASVLTKLSELQLSKLPELTNLWKEEFRAAFCNLRILEVVECGKLKTLVPSLASFENLTTLEVSRCHGFFNLVACSAAKSLMLLEKMSITDCRMIEEIIACEGEDIKGGIVFNRLKYLRLSCLPSLAGFSLEDHNFEFPVLEKVIVRQCPKMKNFCEGDLSTPKLQRVQLTGDNEDEKRWRWDGNLETTIQQLFKEMMNIQNSEADEDNLQLPNPE